MNKVDNSYKKVGRLKMNIAKAINKRCADIYINEGILSHIRKRHKKELSQIGLDAFDYVKTIVNNYNQIRKGTGTSILLIIYKENYHDVAAIDIEYIEKEGIWLVKTAQPRSTKDIQKRQLLR